MSNIVLAKYISKVEQQFLNIFEYKQVNQIKELNNEIYNVQDDVSDNVIEYMSHNVPDKNKDYYSLIIFYSLIASMFTLTANTFIGDFIGLFYPVYLLNKYLTNQTLDIRIIIKYLYTYAHMEFIFQAFFFLYIPFFKYIRLAIIFIMMLSINRESSLIDNMYIRFVAADSILYNEIVSIYRKIIKKLM